MKSTTVIIVIVFVILNMVLMLFVESKASTVLLYDNWYLVTVDKKNAGYCHENMNKVNQKFAYKSVCEIEVSYLFFTYKYKQIESAVLTDEGLESFESQIIEGDNETTVIGEVFPDYIQLVLRESKKGSRSFRLSKADFDSSSIEFNLPGWTGWIADGVEKSYKILDTGTGKIIETNIKPIGFKSVPYQNNKVKVQVIESYSEENGRRESWLTRQGILVFSEGDGLNLTLTDKEGLEKQLPKAMKTKLIGFR